MSDLREAGWRWEHWTGRRSLPVGYMKGAPKVWYSSGLSPHRRYLELIVRAEDLFDRGLAMVPHARRPEVHEGIHEGNFDLSRMPRDTLQLDVEGVPAPPRPRRAGGGRRGPVAPPGAPALEDEDVDLEEELGNLLDEEGYIDDQGHDDLVADDYMGGGISTPSAGDADEALGGEPLGDVVLGDAPPSPVAPPMGADVPAAAEGALVLADDDGEVVARELRGGKWGVFGITPKQAGQGGKWGGYQARCPFHAKNPMTGCKRFFRLDGPTKDDTSKTLRLMMQWCIDARGFQRQRVHL